MPLLPRSACVSVLLALVACSGADPGGASDPLASGDAGAPPPAAPAADAAPPDDPGVLIANPVDGFTGAPPYASDLPAIRANAMHANGPVTGQPCLSCHDGVTCVKFDFAGTVWRAPAFTEAVPDVEVRVIDANDYAHSVHSDADGNFWHRASTDLPLPAFSGVRTAHFTALGKLNGTSCNTCHNATNTHPGPLFVE
jgi:hypothetical protein